MMSRVRGYAASALLLAVLAGFLFYSEDSAEAVCTSLGTTTPNLGLCKPNNAETGWANAINDNWAILDNVVPPGAVMFYAAATPPNGWYACDGSAKSRTTDAGLFAVVGTTFGPGDGSTTFNLPDARSRNVVAAGQGTGLSARSLAATGGTETHTLTTAQMPSHTHPFGFTVLKGNGGGQFGYGGVVNTSGTSTTAISLTATGSTGGGSSHNVMDPFLVLTCMIKR